MSIIQLVIGDNDKVKNFFIDSNPSEEEVIKAYCRGTSIVGFDLVADLFTDPEKFTIVDEIKIDSLKKLGFTVDPSFSDPNSYFHMYLFIVVLGNPNFSFKLVGMPTIDIKGYGLVH